jgi:hypothetical protein
MRQHELETASDDAKRARARADAMLKKADLSVDDDEVVDAHHDFIGRWLEGIEREHVAKTVQLELHEGKGAQAKLERAQLETDVETLEQAHELAFEKYAALSKLVRSRPADTANASGNTEE